MTEEELKTLPPEPAVETVEIAVEQKPQKAAADEAADQLQKQLEAAKANEKALRETADAERQRRIVAEQQAREREQEATQYRGQVQSEQLNAISAAIDGATRIKDMAQVELEHALEAGQFKKVAVVQVQLAEAAAKLENLNQAKNYAETNQPPVNEGRIQQPQPVQHVDPVERLIGSATAASQSWLRQNKQFVRVDRQGNARVDDRVMDAHEEALRKGIAADTPEYFSYIDGRVKSEPNGDRGDVATAQPQKQQQARNAPVAAPVSRESSVNGSRTTIRLTAQEVEAAHMYGDPKKTEREREIQYWNDKQALAAEGKIGNYRH